MKVHELIELLKQEDPEALVVLQKDAEGNGYSPCYGAEKCAYEADTTWSGTAYHPGEFDEDEHETISAVVLWPVN